MLDLQYWYNLCNDIYGIDFTAQREKNMERISSSNNDGRVLYVNSIEDPWLSVSVLPQGNVPERLWYLDKMGGPKYLEMGLDGQASPLSGTSSELVKCTDCAHCSDVGRPRKDKDSDGMKESRERIIKWVHSFVMDP